MSSISIVNPKADILRKSAALSANCAAAKALVDFLRTSFGPTGTMKMLVGGAGQVKITKDGNVLLNEMQIQHPTAALIARAATAQDSITGDGTTSTVILLGEILRHCESYISYNAGSVHPRVLCSGIEKGKEEVLRLLEEIRATYTSRVKITREVLYNVAYTSISTKLSSKLSTKLANVIVDAMGIIRKPEKMIDLFMIEILHIKQQFATDTSLIRGMVLDHGPRHPDMPSRLSNCCILTLNVSLEYEKTEVNSGFFYSSAEQRQKLVQAERRFTDDKVRKIIELKREACTPENKRSFVVLNQKGIDPFSLDMLAKENIIALRRVKRRNMERLTLCCGGNPLNSVLNMSQADLGFAAEVYVQVVGDERYTFVEGVQSPESCTILVKGADDHTIAQVKDAIRDGLRAVKNAIEDNCVIPGAGAVEIAAYKRLHEFAKGFATKTKLGIMVLAEALLAIPMTIIANSGNDPQEAIIQIQQEKAAEDCLVGVDIVGKRPISPEKAGVWDNYSVKKQIFSIAPTLAQQLLLVDEIIKAGKQMRPANNAGPQMQ